MPGLCYAVIALAGVGLAGAESAGVTLKAIPGALHWTNAPASFAVRGDDALEIVSPGRTDWFTAPFDGAGRANSPRLMFDADADFVLRAKVTADFRSPWDAGVLVVWADATHWAKLCFEYSTDKKGTIVSVVTRGLSDDANAFPVDGNSVWLQVARMGPGLVFYASPDGHAWRIIRAFTFGDTLDQGTGKMQAGFSSQSPMGEGHRTVFSDIRYRPRRPADWWRGE
jgi:uncharacterized protein